MNYAIIKAGNTDMLEVIELRDWESHEWDNFATVKDRETSRIVWFEKEEDAIEFMIANFPKQIIDPKYFNETSFNKRYYID